MDFSSKTNIISRLFSINKLFTIILIVLTTTLATQTTTKNEQQINNFEALCTQFPSLGECLKGILINIDRNGERGKAR